MPFPGTSAATHSTRCHARFRSDGPARCSAATTKRHVIARLARNHRSGGHSSTGPPCRKAVIAIGPCGVPSKFLENCSRPLWPGPGGSKSWFHSAGDAVDREQKRSSRTSLFRLAWFCHCLAIPAAPYLLHGTRILHCDASDYARGRSPSRRQTMTENAATIGRKSANCGLR